MFDSSNNLKQRRNMEVKKCVYTIGDFIRELSWKYRHEWVLMEKVNIQSDEALEMLNRCLPRNLIVQKIFREDEKGISIIDVFSS